MKKWLRRLIVLWLVILPFVLYAAEPFLLAFSSEQAQKQAYGQCLLQTASLPRQFPPEQPQRAEQYCNCMKTGVWITREVILDKLLRNQVNPDFQARIARQATTCNQLLHP